MRAFNSTGLLFMGDVALVTAMGKVAMAMEKAAMAKSVMASTSGSDNWWRGGGCSGDW